MKNKTNLSNETFAFGPVVKLFYSSRVRDDNIS